MVIMQGMKAADGSCRQRVAFDAPTGDDRPQEARLVAVDPATCRIQVQYGYPQNETPDATDGTVTTSETTVVVGGD